jgi:hypothetical protein
MQRKNLDIIGLGAIAALAWLMVMLLTLRRCGFG